MPARAGEGAAVGSRLDSRNQARWISHPRPTGQRSRLAYGPQRLRFHNALSEDRGGGRELPIDSCLIDGEAIVVDEARHAPKQD
jgi:hypothetical protein